MVTHQVGERLSGLVIGRMRFVYQWVTLNETREFGCFFRLVRQHKIVAKFHPGLHDYSDHALPRGLQTSFVKFITCQFYRLINIFDP